MNDKRFIELLNLYVDQELTDDEARALEQEIAQSQDRRRVYTQYCRMQRACVRLLEQQAAPAPQIASLAAAATAEGPAVDVGGFQLPVSEPVVMRPHRGFGWIGWGGGLAAAAACVALVIATQNRVRETAPSATDFAAVAETPAPPIAEPPAVAAAAADRPSSDYRPVVVVNALLRPTAEQVAAPSPLDASSLDWLQEMKLLPMRRVPFETLRFDPQGSLHVDQTAFASDESDEAGTTEISAFQFQR